MVSDKCDRAIQRRNRKINESQSVRTETAEGDLVFLKNHRISDAASFHVKSYIICT